MQSCLCTHFLYYCDQIFPNKVLKILSNSRVTTVSGNVALIFALQCTSADISTISWVNIRNFRGNTELFKLQRKVHVDALFIPRLTPELVTIPLIFFAQTLIARELLLS